MSDERSTTINLPLVQSSGSLNSSNATNGNGVNSQQTPQTPTLGGGGGSGGGGSGSSGSGGSITIQTTLPGSSSFSVGTKANQSIISDAPVTDPGGNTTKQVIFKITTHYTPPPPPSTLAYIPSLTHSLPTHTLSLYVSACICTHLSHTYTHTYQIHLVYQPIFDSVSFLLLLLFKICFNFRFSSLAPFLSFYFYIHLWLALLFPFRCYTFHFHFRFDFFTFSFFFLAYVVQTRNIFIK